MHVSLRNGTESPISDNQKIILDSLFYDKIPSTVYLY